MPTITERYNEAEAERARLAESCAGLEKSLAEALAALAQKEVESAADHQGAIEAAAAAAASAVALEEEREKHATTAAELARARRALANPAFAAAAVAGADAAVPEGGAEAGSVLSCADAYAEYSRIADPRQRAIYRREHAVELGLN